MCHSRLAYIVDSAGVLDRAEEGRVVFPYDAIHVDFLLRAA